MLRRFTNGPGYASEGSILNSGMREGPVQSFQVMARGTCGSRKQVFETVRVSKWHQASDVQHSFVHGFFAGDVVLNFNTFDLTFKP